MKDNRFNLLIVDDEIMVIRAIARVLDNNVYCIYQAVDAVGAIEILKSVSIDVIISDQRMPYKTGLELLKAAKEAQPSAVRILMSGYADIDVVIAAINEGQIYQYITKPWDNNRLIDTIENAIEHKKEEDEKAQILAVNLEKTNEWNTVINQMGNELEKKKDNTINALLKVLKVKDNKLYKHSVCVSETAACLADLMGFSREQIETVRYAGLFHDVGKISIRDKIMYKPGSLDEDEYEAMKSHPLVSAEILREVDFLGTIADITEQHHERMDGTGYPKGMKKDDIHIEAQTIAVADAFEALREDRVYRAGMKNEEALRIIISEKGKYNLEIINALENAIDSARVDLANYNID